MPDVGSEMQFQVGIDEMERRRKIEAERRNFPVHALPQDLAGATKVDEASRQTREQALIERMDRPDETVPGGIYRVRGVLVDCDGIPLDPKAFGTEVSDAMREEIKARAALREQAERESEVEDREATKTARPERK